MELTKEQVNLLVKNKIIPEGTPIEQIQFFAEVCQRKKLDPFQRQIHLIERREKDKYGNWKKSYTIQAGIDGMRAIAQRNCKVISYRRWVEKREDDLYGCCQIETADRGTYYDELPYKEYVQLKNDGKPVVFWQKFPQTMIKKCAEESVLRMMVPEDLSGIYGDDEMMQADSEVQEEKLLKPEPPKLNEPPKIIQPINTHTPTETASEKIKPKAKKSAKKLSVDKLSNKIKKAKSLEELKEIWESLDDNEKGIYRELFGFRKEELKKVIEDKAKEKTNDPILDKINNAKSLDELKRIYSELDPAQQDKYISPITLKNNQLTANEKND